MTKQTVLDTTGATAVQGEEWRIGPPPHEKGPLIWMDMDQVELDASYDQIVYAPFGDQIRKRRASNSEAVRARLGLPLRKSYGPTEIEKLDIYRSKNENAPIFIFVHGGAWLRGEAKNFADSAENIVNAGAHYVSLDFSSITQAGGDLRVMVDQVRRGIAWTYKNADTFGGDADRLYIGGQSSGGHLSAVALVMGWQKDFGLPEDIVKGAICMSAMYDMKPVRLSKRSSYVKFTDEIEQAMSPQRQIDCLHTPMVVTYGTRETPDFKRQSRDFAAAVKAAGKPVQLIEAIGYDHFEMGESLGHPYGPNGRAALALMKLAAP